MAGVAALTVVWVAEQRGYARRESRGGEVMVRDGAEWLAWLDAQRSFSFHGAAGQVSLLKETRAGSRAGYWYAYRRHGRRTRKQYAGRSADLSFERLEAIAAALNQPAAPTASGDRHVSAAHDVLLASKLQIPRLPSALVARERLFAALDAGRQRLLTLICAPPGYGKTTLVRQWIAGERREAGDWRLAEATLAPGLQPRAPHVAWIALDAGDNDPLRFWRYLISACQGLQEDGAAAALAALQLPAQPSFEPSPLEPALTILLNALTHAARPGLIILDDYHLISAPRIHATLTFFLEHLPTALHVIVISRHEPPLPLARLRARGELCELTRAELRFTAEEMARFLESAGVPPLPLATLRELGEQLEGWPAGLRLLALALGTNATPGAISATLATFAGSRRPLLEYFVNEVLRAQPDALQDFLLRTSTLRRLSAALCDAVTGAPDSAALIAALEQANLFLEPADDSGQWYRYHGLFAEAMQSEARRRLGDAAVRELARRASVWYEQHGMRADAIETALHAEDTDRAADLLARLSVTAHLGLDSVQINSYSEFHTLRRWLEQIPDAALDQRPVLLISYATALLFVGLVDQAALPRPVVAQIEALLGRAEAAFQAADARFHLGAVFAFRSMLTRQRGALEEAVRWGERALTLLPPDELSWRSIALGAVGLGALDAGRFDAAEAAIQEARALCVRIGNRWWTRANTAMLSYVLLERGGLHQAAARFEHMLAEAREQDDSDDVARAQICLAQIAYEWNNLDTAQQAASEGLALGEHLASEEIWAQAALRLARVQHAQGQTAAARQRLAVVLARLHASGTQLALQLAREVQLAEARIQLAAGDIAAVRRWAESVSGEPEPAAKLRWEREARLVAQLQIAQGNPDTALAALAPMLESAQSAGRNRCAIEIRALLALAHAARGERLGATRHLRAALLDTVAEGYQRLFLDLGAGMQELLTALYAAEREPRLRQYIAGLRHPGGAQPTAPGADALIEPLSLHERRVLQLLVAGRSNPEIARELIVSVNTVRSQVQSVYRKLGVHNRVAASDLARQLGLLREPV